MLEWIIIILILGGAVAYLGLRVMKWLRPAPKGPSRSRPQGLTVGGKRVR